MKQKSSGSTTLELGLWAGVLGPAEIRPEAERLREKPPKQGGQKRTSAERRRFRELNKLKGFYKGRPHADLRGRTFGFVTVTRYAGSCEHQPRWECLCKCGRTKILRGNHLLSGKTISCGCQTSTGRPGKENKHWKGCGDLPGSYMAFLRASAKARRLSIHVTIADLWNLFQKQNGKCALTGLVLALSGKNRARGTASLDRINSKLAYTSDNIQWVHKDVNRMKSDFEQRYFIELCKQVVKQQALSEE